MDSTAATAVRKPCFSVRLCAELKRLALLTIVVGLLIIAAKYYCFDRLDGEIRATVERQLREHYQGLSVSVRSARRVAGRGVEIRGVRIAEAGRGAPVLAEIDEIFAECDTRLPDFLTKPPHITTLRVHRLKLRAERKASGFWNLSYLLPLPPCQSRTAPVAIISDASLEVVDPTQATEGQPCAWTLRNIELAVEPQSADGAPGRPEKVLHVHGTLAGDYVERVEIDGLLNPQTSRWELRGAVAGLEFSPRLRAALPRELGQVLAPISSIRGRTFFGFHAERAARPANGGQQVDTSRLPDDHLPPLSFVIHGKISEGRIDDARLPEPLTDVEATIHCDNHGVLIRELSARCGVTHIDLDASLAGYTSAAPMDIQLAAQQLQLERLPTATLPTAIRQAWEQFRPRGLADISGRMKFDGRQWQPELKIDCRELSFAYDKFPYRLTDGNGRIIVQPNSVQVRLKTNGGGQVVHCRADIGSPGLDFLGTIEVESEGPVPIDEKLLTAMDAETQRLVRSFRPRGSATFRARFERDRGQAAIHRQLNIGLVDCSIQHEQFPYPIDKVSGSLELGGESWVFRNLNGRNDSATISGEGSWLDVAGLGKQLDLHFAASDVPLADELRQALPPAQRRLWSTLRPRGNIDRLLVGLRFAVTTGQWSVNVQAEKRPATETADSRAISLEPTCFPYALNNLTGTFRYHDGTIRLEKLHAVHGRASVAAEGLCRVLANGGCRLELTRLAAEHVELDQELTAALSASAGQALARVPLEGPLTIEGMLGITAPAQAGAATVLDWNLSLDIENGRLLTPTPVEQLRGGLWCKGEHFAGGLSCQGELKFDSAFVRGIQLTNVEGPFRFDGRRLLFGSTVGRDAQGRTPRQATARVLGGLLSLDGELSLAADGAFRVQTTLGNADLAVITRELAPHHRGLSGKVFGQANLAGNAQGKHTWRGDGQVRLRDADIYELPAMINLLKLLSVQRPDRTAFTTSNIDFRIEGDDLMFERIDFSGDAITLKGTGHMYGQRQIDLKFYPLVGREERQLAIFRPLIGETGRQFMLVEVTGTLDHPDIRRTVLPKIDARLAQLFPELAVDEVVKPTLPIISAPREAINRLTQPLRR